VLHPTYRYNAAERPSYSLISSTSKSKFMSEHLTLNIS
jgi:hypothetical protein